MQKNIVIEYFIYTRSPQFGCCRRVVLSWGTQNHQKPCFWYQKNRLFGIKSFVFHGCWCHLQHLKKKTTWLLLLFMSGSTWHEMGVWGWMRLYPVALWRWGRAFGPGMGCVGKALERGGRWRNVCQDVWSSLKDVFLKVRITRQGAFWGFGTKKCSWDVFFHPCRSVMFLTLLISLERFFLEDLGGEVYQGLAAVDANGQAMNSLPAASRSLWGNPMAEGEIIPFS